MTLDNPLYTLRAVETQDIPFIYNSWLKSYRDSATVAGVPNTIYYGEHHRVIEKILNSAGTLVTVAVNSDDLAQIFGYIVGRKLDTVNVIDWLYVKHPFRGHGIGKALEAIFATAPTPVHYTHRVKHAERVLKSRNYIYNPYLLMGSAT